MRAIAAVRQRDGRSSKPAGRSAARWAADTARVPLGNNTRSIPRPLQARYRPLTTIAATSGGSSGGWSRHQAVSHPGSLVRRLASAAGGGSSSDTPSVVREAGSQALHPAALLSLYATYFCACFIERTWRFGLPLCLAFIPGGFQAIATLGFAAPLACSLAGPAVGRLLDSVYRPLGLGAMLVAQDVSILLSCVTLVAAAATPNVPLSASPLFAVLVVLAMAEKLASISSELAIERDWVTQLAGKRNVLALARSNAYLRRCDLLTELIGALVFGWIYSWGGLKASMAFTAVLAAAVVPLQLFFIARIADLAPTAMVHGRQEPGAGWARLPGWHGFVENARLRKRHAAEAAAKRKPLLARARQQLAHALDGWQTYFRQPILPSSLTFVLLFFNVVLSPGGLVTHFLTLWGFDGRAMAVFRSGCATCGFLGTLIGKRLIQRLGLLRAGRAALLMQVALLGGATLIFSLSLSGPPQLGPAGGGGATSRLLLGSTGVGVGALASGWPTLGGVSLPVAAFAALVVMSRVGMWSFDLVNSQLFQQTVSPREIASASSAEMALCSFSELIMLGAAALSAGPASFPFLVYSSFAAVVAANCVFRGWAAGAQPRIDAAIADASGT